MRAWSLTRLRAISRLRPASRLDRIACLQPLSSRPFCTKISETPTPLERIRLSRKYALFDKIERPGDDIGAWTSLLDGGLPPHLRNWESPDSPPNLSAADVAEVLLTARRLPLEQGGPLDLLYHLGFEQNRWNAVVWLIKRLVEKFPARHVKSPRLSRTNALWDQVPSLHDFTSDVAKANLSLEASVPRTGVVEAKSLHELTDGLHPETMSREEIIRHDALGEIWLTLGSMIKACANDGDIKPEVLETIAYLHHKEVMPLSIYQAEPPADRSAIHQPPLLSMLSSRILTSLSDAAWRAHEKIVIEEAKARGADYAALRPEIPGSVYRTNVAGLRPEVWMELVLWSCLHGGWIAQGADILAPLGEPSSRWATFSWRQYEDIETSGAHGKGNSWNDLEYLFKTRAGRVSDASRGLSLSVKRKVSAEVVNAYIDALITMVNVGVGDRGVDIDEVIGRLRDLKRLLHQKGRRSTTLSTGSWDSLVLRLVESRRFGVESDSTLVNALVQLSPGLGQGLESRNTEDLPAYVLDGSMAMQGLLHRALRGQILAGSFEGALEIFSNMQKRADVDKKKSLESFMEGKQPLLRSLTKGDLFTSNLTGIDYPAFEVQIPTTTLGAFLELATDAKAYDFAKWLLYNDDVDGPAIDESCYHDRHIQPSVLRFAAETQDNKLLSKVRELGIERRSFRSLLDSQFNTLRWDSAEYILQHLADSRGITWSTQNLANSIRVMLQQVPGANCGDPESRNNLDRAKAIIAKMCSRRYRYNKSEEVIGPIKLRRMQNLLTVLSAVNGEWQQFCSAFRQPGPWRSWDLPIKSFNAVLEGVSEAYGSPAARRLLGLFWPHSARRAFDAQSKFIGSRRSRMQVARHRPTALESVSRQRISVPIFDAGGSRLPDLVVYGACEPNTDTIMIILRKALEELRSTTQLKSSGEQAEQVAHDSQDEFVDNTPRGMVTWGVRRLFELQSVAPVIIEHIDQLLSEIGMEDLRELLPAIVEEAADEAEDPY